MGKRDQGKRVQAWSWSVRTFLVACLGCCLAVAGATFWLSPFSATTARVPAEEAPAVGPMVLAISVDGLNPRAIRQLGADEAPTLWGMATEGASTLNARTSLEMTSTLPNHTGMVTSRRIKAAAGGHGVTWNDERLQPATVQAAAGHPVSSVFSLADDAGLRTGLFAGKQKFSLFDRSWPGAIDQLVLDTDSTRLMNEVKAWVTSEERPDFTFWHIALPDEAGHRSGWMSPEYLAAVREVDEEVGAVLAAIDSDATLRESFTIVLTADHGGKLGASEHSSEPSEVENYTVPFLVDGQGVVDQDLYSLNPAYRDPANRRPAYAAPRQPIRNGDLGNLVASLLGLGPIPGSGIGDEQTLQVR